MKITDLMSYHQCRDRDELSKKIGYSKVTLWKWGKKGIPLRTQATFEVVTGGKLKADRQALIDQGQAYES